MTRRIVVFTLATFIAASVSAQTSRTGGQSAEMAAERLEEIKARLKLTPEQEAAVKPILQREFEKARSVIQALDKDSASRREKRKAARELRTIRDDADRQLKTILTKEQLSELKRIREERREKLRSARGGA